MTTAAWVVLGLAAVAALVDWVAVATHRHTLEYAAKPATLALVIATALTLDPVDGLRRAYIVTGLLFGLAGDVLLMLPGAEEADAHSGGGTTAARRDGGPPPQRRAPTRPPRPAHWPPWFDPFVLGLAAFLVGHVNYILGFRTGGPGLDRVAIALVAVAVVALPLGTLVARALAARGEEALRLPVSVYVAVLSGMTASAVATGSVLAGTGAWLFVVSDATLATNRFLRSFRAAPVIVAVTYHLAQALIVLSLARA